MSDLLPAPEIMSEVDNKPFKVWICWGKDEPTDPRCHEFETEELLNAFLDGVNEASGWLSHEEFATQDEAIDWLNSAYDDEYEDEFYDDEEGA